MVRAGRGEEAGLSPGEELQVATRSDWIVDAAIREVTSASCTREPSRTSSPRDDGRLSSPADSAKVRSTAPDPLAVRTAPTCCTFSRRPLAKAAPDVASALRSKTSKKEEGKNVPAGRKASTAERTSLPIEFLRDVHREHTAVLGCVQGEERTLGCPGQRARSRSARGRSAGQPRSACRARRARPVSFGRSGAESVRQLSLIHI